jgi:RimJ/RimL family protein N-acetyltransferase
VREIPAIAPELVADSLVLSQLDENYFDAYCKLIADPISQHWTVTTETFSDEQLMSWLKSRPGQPDRLDWAIVDKVTGQLLGEIVLNELDASAESMNLRIALLSANLGKGIGTQAVKLVVDFGFHVLNLREIRLDVWSENLRAIRVYQKVGFVSQAKIVDDGKEFLVMHAVNPAQ